MAVKTNLQAVMTEVADAIRDKLGYEAEDYPIAPVDFASEIINLPQQSGGSTYVDPAPIIEGTISSVTNYATYIKSQTFYACPSLSYADFPSCTTIGTSVFKECPTLSYISFPVLTFVDRDVFYNCYTLPEVDLPECSFVSTSAFGNCYAVSSISLPKCKKIYNSAFISNSALQSVYIPACSYIGPSAFAYCKNIESIDMHNVETIGDGAFYQYPSTGSAFSILSLSKCSSIGTNGMGSALISSYNLPKLYFTGANALGYTNLTSITLPNLTQVNGKLWVNASYMQSVDLPDAVTFYQAFYNMTALTSVSLPKLGGVGQSAFSGCTGLTSLYLPEVSYVQGWAFNGATNLSIISMPKLRSLYSSAMTGCYLSEFISPTLSYVQYRALGGMPNVKLISCPNLQTLSYATFMGNTNVEEIFIPLVTGFPTSTNATYQKMFAQSPKLSKITILNSACTMNSRYAAALASTPFMDSSYLGYYGSFYVPNKWLASYKARANWSKMSDRITALDSSWDADNVYPYEFYSESATLTEIPSDKLNAKTIWKGAFSFCEKITSASFPLCSSVGYMAFTNCYGLKTISFPQCSYYGVSAFAYCYNLEEVSFPSNVLFDNYAFQGCYSLSKITFESGTTIGAWAFADCRPSLRSITIPEDARLESGVFEGCSNLSIVNMPNRTILPRALFARTAVTTSTFDFTSFTEIGASAFYHCLSLSGALSLSSPIISDYAFQDCSYITKILFDDPVIRNYAFYNNYALSAIYMLSGYFSANWPFMYCSNLSSAYFYSSGIMSYDSMNTIGIFDYTPISTSGYIYVRQSLVSLYQEDQMWSRYSSRFVGLTDQEMNNIFAAEFGWWE